MSLAGHTPLLVAPVTMEAAADVACQRRFVYEALSRPRSRTVVERVVEQIAAAAAEHS